MVNFRVTCGPDVARVRLHHAPAAGTRAAERVVGCEGAVPKPDVTLRDAASELLKVHTL
jgi:hypothetical protein